MSRPASLLKLEHDAYYAVLRALAVNELDWTKEKLLTDLRKVLNITNDQHFKFLEEVMEDKLVLRLQESRNQGATTPVPPTFDMPPPSRQQPQGQTNSAHRKPGRPPSATARHQAPIASPLGGRTSRAAEPALSGEKRGRGKRDRDDGLEPRRSSFGGPKSIKTSFGGRSRGRGRRISGLTREVVPMQPLQVVSKYKFVPFKKEFLQSRIANGSTAELQDMQMALLQKEQAIQHHLDLLLQLEDESLGASNALQFCQLLIQELELADESISLELEYLKEADEEDP